MCRAERVMCRAEGVWYGPHYGHRRVSVVGVPLITSCLCLYPGGDVMYKAEWVMCRAEGVMCRAERVCTQGVMSCWYGMGHDCSHRRVSVVVGVVLVVVVL